jgi:hypothetical protein
MKTSRKLRLAEAMAGYRSGFRIDADASGDVEGHTLEEALDAINQYQAKLQNQPSSSPVEILP